MGNKFTREQLEELLERNMNSTYNRRICVAAGAVGAGVILRYSHEIAAAAGAGLLVFDLVNGDTQVNKTGQSLGALGRSTFTNFNVASEASQVTVTGEVRTEAGEIKLCQPTAVKVDC